MLKETSETWQRKEDAHLKAQQDPERKHLMACSTAGLPRDSPGTATAVRQGQMVLGSGTDQMDLFAVSPGYLLMELAQKALSEIAVSRPAMNCAECLQQILKLSKKSREFEDFLGLAGYNFKRNLVV